LFGQAGSDFLFGEAGNDLGIGGTGNDQVFGGAGADVIVGGEGRDVLFGGAGEDLLVHGSTADDNNLAALESLLVEWSSRRSYRTRVANLRSIGVGEGNDDEDADVLWGQAGLDWFVSGAEDQVKDLGRAEHRN
jgi:Ca2+-binding RTX toxin-like protein